MLFLADESFVFVSLFSLRQGRTSSALRSACRERMRSKTAQIYLNYFNNALFHALFVKFITVGVPDSGQRAFCVRMQDGCWASVCSRVVWRNARSARVWLGRRNLDWGGTSMQSGSLVVGWSPYRYSFVWIFGHDGFICLLVRPYRFAGMAGWPLQGLAMGAGIRQGLGGLFGC